MEQRHESRGLIRSTRFLDRLPIAVVLHVPLEAYPQSRPCKLLLLLTLQVGCVGTMYKFVCLISKSDDLSSRPHVISGLDFLHMQLRMCMLRAFKDIVCWFNLLLPNRHVC